MKVALQMYSVKQHMDADPMATMRKCAELGYRNWEICEIFNSNRPYNYGLCLPVDEGRALLKELGVRVIGCHLSSRVMESEEQLKEFFDYQAAIGCENPGLAMDFFPDEEYIKRFGEKLNHMGQLCHERGMRFHYHNHWQEFQKFGEKYVLDLIAEYSDPALVDLELDTYWAARGGLDPVEAIERFRDRLVMLHQKDMPECIRGHINVFEEGIVKPGKPIGMEEFSAANKPEYYTEVGCGIMDIQAIIDKANEVGIPYITLEQDCTARDELESIAISMDSFHKFSGLEWD